jgi:hypothetical protein
MVPRGLDLEMEGGHVGVKARGHEGVGIDARLREMRRRAVEDAVEGAQGLQEGRHAELIECRRVLLFPSARFGVDDPPGGRAGQLTPPARGASGVASSDR